ncbi:MAG: LPS export ABC transporter permease LptG [Desulfatibacillaceae bacterium]|nr:LPS export ABC transporter permease LptG [Desulfatibacillaceae bacterium]
MKILTRYIGFSLARQLFVMLAAVVVIYLAIDFFEKIDDFMDQGLPFSTALWFFALRLPLVISQVAPVGVLLSVLVVFGIMARHNEIIALRCGGAGSLRLLAPVLVFALAATFALMAFMETVLPGAARKANSIWYGQVRNETPVAGRGSNIWYAGDGFFVHVGSYLAAEKTALDVTVAYLDENFNLVRRLDAVSGVYDQNLWRLVGVLEQDLADGLKMAHLQEAWVDLGFSDADLTRVARRPEEMDYSLLMDHARTIEARGYNASRHRADAHAKIAFPFVCVIMGIIGGALSLRKKRGEGLAVTIVWGMGLAFAYWVVHSMSLSLGYAGRLPPLGAAWAANGIFALLAFSLVRRLE